MHDPVHVNNFLSDILRGEYTPNKHWTSDLRSRASHKPYNSQEPDVSTFTVHDTSGRLKEFLQCKGYQQFESLIESSTFHIQLVVSEGPVNSAFEIDSAQVNKAKKLSFVDSDKQRYAAIFVLAFVFDLYTDPAIALFADPWQLHRNGSLFLETYSKYEGCFNEKTPVFYIHRGENPTSPFEAGRGQKIFKYQDLKPGEIRVLQISPGKGNEPITGTIRHVSIDCPGTFWAISYVWGTPTKRFYVETPGGKIPLTLSLDY